MNRPLGTPFKPTARERLDDYIAEQHASAQRSKEQRMKTRKTAQGDTVKRFTDVADRATRIAEVRQKVAEAFEEAERAASLNSRMSAVEKVDSTRFRVLGGGA